MSVAGCSTQERETGRQGSWMGDLLDHLGGIDSDLLKWMFR